MPPTVGETVPDFEALLCDGEVFEDAKLSEVVGDRGAVLYFQGFVFSAIARHWWKRFDRRDWDEFSDVPVFGVGRDGPFAQNEFFRQIKSPFRTFSDVDGQVMDAYDLRMEREGMANTSTPYRSVFVIDPDLEVQFSWVAPDTVTPPPADEVEEAVESL
ncbi:redoxin domain-containing protein [Natrialbaceae archaeon A-chndr2]|uniref:redoxin domain-containing protein n=1 Tax=Natronosalvus amylolyticus TaxID=2961994 RepID=UPI0020C9A7C2|nr:redoxin domain-containing protein [Natronosalvus amylolyticus]